MAQTNAFDAGRIAMSDALVTTLARATDYAAVQAHGSVTLEHLLLSLTEDADAAHVLEASTVDLTRLRNDVAGFLGQQPPTAPAGVNPPLDPDLSRILTYAEAAARTGGRPEINGAIVLAAIVGEGKSMAATFLKAQGMTFAAAIRVIRQGPASPPPQAPAPAPAPTPEATAPPATTFPATAAEPPRPMPGEHSPTERDTRRREAGSTQDSRAPAPQKPLWEPMGIPTIRPDPPPRPEPAPRRAAEPRAPAPVQEPPPREAPNAPTPEVNSPPPAPPPPPVARESKRAERATEPPIERAPVDEVAPPAPPPPTKTAPDIYDGLAMRRSEPSAPSGPPPLPSRDAGRRAPEGPPPIPPPPPRGLGSARPPPPRPNLRLPPREPEDVPVTAPWPAETTDQRTPPIPPARARAGAPALDHLEHDHRAARGTPPRAGRGAARPAVELGQLVENIPRKMKVGVAETFEVRIARETIDASRGVAGRGAPQQHQILITRAMSVRLQGEPGRFYVECSSPETQWTGARGDQLVSDYAVWRFTAIPQRRGPAELTLVVSARSIGTDGVVADTSLPEQRIGIRVSANLTRGLGRWLGWITVAILGGVLAKVGETFWEPGLALIRRLLSI